MKLLKPFATLVLILVIYNFANAQRKALLEQIAALQVYIGHVQKGYAVAREGLTTIGAAKEGEVKLHSDYFNSLRSINPVVLSYWKVSKVASYWSKILRVSRNATEELEKGKMLSLVELDYITMVCDKVIKDYATSVEDLLSIISNNKLEITDSERLSRIDAIYDDVNAQLTFIQGFLGEARTLALARINEQNDINKTEVLHGIQK